MNPDGVMLDARAIPGALFWGDPRNFAGIRAIQRIICLGLDLAGIHIRPGPIVKQSASCDAYWDELLGWGFGPRA